MNETDTREVLQERIREISPLQFRHFCKIVIEEIEQPTIVEVVDEESRQRIDIRGRVGDTLYNGEFGVQVRQYDSEIEAGTVRELVETLKRDERQFGTLITTSSFADDAVAAVNETERHSIELIDGDDLIELLLDHEIGVEEQPSEGDREFVTDPEFWTRFEKFADDLIPSRSVPQADNFDIVELTMEAVADGCQYKPEILDRFVEATGDSWAPRQVDYYTTACQAVGYLEADDPDDDRRRTRKWTLTESGEEYVRRLRSGDDEAAADHLGNHVENIEIVARVAEQIREDFTVPNATVERIIREETEVSGTTVTRRTTTVGKWLSKHPDIKRREKDTVLFEHYEKDLSDFQSA